MSSKFLADDDDDNQISTLTRRLDKYEQKDEAAAASWMPTMLAPAQPVRTISEIPGLTKMLAGKVEADVIENINSECRSILDSTRVNADNVAGNSLELNRLNRVIELLTEEIAELRAGSRRSSASEFEIIHIPPS